MPDTSELLQTMAAPPREAQPAYSASTQDILGAMAGNEDAARRSERSRRMEEARLADASEGDTDFEAVTRDVARVLPFVREGFNWSERSQYAGAQERLRAGNPRPEDYNAIARYERHQREEEEKNSTTLGHLGQRVLQLPGEVAEFMAGGRLLGAVGIGAPQALSRASYSSLGAAAGTGGRLVAQTATVPAMYAADWQRRNLEAGRDSADPRGLPAAFGLAMAQTAILGSLGSVANNVGGAGIGGAVTRTAIRTGTGLLEQQAADVVGSALGLQTGYGTIGAIIRGDHDVLKNLAGQALTFAAFGGMHEIGAEHPLDRPGMRGERQYGQVEREAPPPVLEAFQNALGTLARRGVSRETAAERLSQPFEVMRHELDAQPDLTRAQARQVVDQLPEGPIRELGRALADSLPERAPTESQPAQVQPGHEAQQVPPGATQEAPGGQAQPAETPQTQSPQAPPAPLTPERQREVALSVIGSGNLPADQAGTLLGQTFERAVSMGYPRDLTTLNKAHYVSAVAAHGPQFLEGEFARQFPARHAETSPVTERRGSNRPPQGVWDHISAEHPEWNAEQIGREAARRADQLSVDAQTGLGSRAKFVEDAKSGQHGRHVSIYDVPSMHEINNHFGDHAGDALLAAHAAAMREAGIENGYRKGGDELGAFFPNRHAQVQAGARYHNILREMEVTWRDANGQVVTVKGFGIARAEGASLEQAQARLPAAKEAASERGFRSQRPGELPPGLTVAVESGGTAPGRQVERPGRTELPAPERQNIPVPSQPASSQKAQLRKRLTFEGSNPKAVESRVEQSGATSAHEWDAWAKKNNAYPGQPGQLKHEYARLLADEVGHTAAKEAEPAVSQAGRLRRVKDEASAMMEEAQRHMINNRVPREVQRQVLDHYNQLFRGDPDEAHAYADLMRDVFANNKQDQLAQILRSPEFTKEKEDAIRQASSRSGWGQAPLRRSIEQRLQAGLEIPQAPAQGEGGAGNEGAGASAGPAQAIGTAQAGGEPNARAIAGGQTRGDQLTPTERLALARRAKVQSVLSAAKGRGGISEKSARKMFGKEFIDQLKEAIPTAFQDREGRPGRKPLDELADEMQKAGEIRVPESRHAHDWLLEQIRERAAHMAQDFEAEAKRTQRQFLKEKADAAKEHTPAEVTKAIRDGEEAGGRESTQRAAEEAAGELAPGPSKAGHADDVRYDAKRGVLVDKFGNVLFHEPGTAASPGQVSGPIGANPGAQQGRGSRVGAFEIKATQNELFGNREYVEGTVPGSRTAIAAALLHPEAIVTQKMAAGDPRIGLEENAHIFSVRNGFEANPAILGRDVSEGFRQFWDPQAPMSKRTILEGFAQWMVRRSTGQLAILNNQQAAANRYAENWIKDQGFTEKADRIRDLYSRYQSQTPGQQAAGLVSATGKPAYPEMTQGETVKGWTQRLGEWWQDNVTTNLGALLRMHKEATAKGLNPAVGEDAYTVWSRLMFADKPTAGEFEKNGVWTLHEGKKTTIGPSLDKILEPLHPEDLARYQGDSSKFDVYAIGRHVLDEAQRGRPVVPEDQRLMYERALREFAQDPEFMKRASAAADALTHGFNSTLDALAAPEIHYMAPELAQSLKEARPTYVPTERVLTDAGWKTGTSARRGEQMPKLIHERSGSGERIVSPIVSYKKRLSVTAALLNEQIRRNAVAQYLLAPGMGKWAVAGEETLTPQGQQYAGVLKNLGMADHEIASIMKQLGGPQAAAYFTTQPWPSDGTKPTWFWAGPGGKLTNFRIGDRALYDLITGQQGDANSFVQFVRGVANLGLNTPWGRFQPMTAMAGMVRKGATAVSLGFQIRNIFPTHDPMEFAQNTISQASLKNLPEFYKRAYAFEAAQLTGKVSKDAVFQLYHDLRGEELRKFSFDRSRPQSAYDQLREGERGPVIKTLSGGAELVKDVLSVMGAGENAPRALEFKNFLEKAGYPEARLTKMADRGEQVPFFLLQAAMNAAAEVTVPFGRQGIITRELNKIQPFFGPAVSGVTKALRNWRENPKGAGVVLAAYLSLRLGHWLAYHKEDWYGELSANDKFNNFVVPTPWGLRRMPGARDLNVPIGGLLTTLLDAAAHKNPDFAGLVQQSLSATLPPAPITPAGDVAQSLMRNRNWMGQPIVPRRDENLPASHNFFEHQLPYAAQQLSGGRGELSLRGSGLIPFSEVRSAHRSVDQYYEALHNLEQERNLARRSGMAFKGEGNYQRLHSIEQTMRGLNQRMRTASDTDRAQIRQQQLELARRVLQAGR